MGVAARSRSWLVLLAAFLVALSSVGATHSDFGSADVFLRAADILTSQSNYRDALAMYVRAERVATTTQRVRAGIGITQSAVRIGEFEFAYSKAFQLRVATPNDVAVRSVYGQAAWSAGLFDEAEASFKDVLSVNPDDTRARLGMARVLLARGRTSEALEQALTAVRPGVDADSASVTANIYKRMGRIAQAIVWFTKYRTLIPEIEADTRRWTDGEIVFLKSFGRRTPAEVEKRGAGVIHTIPFTLDHDKVVVRGRVNGSDWVDFVVDTGAEESIVSEMTARRLGVVPISPAISAGVGEIGLRGLQHGTIGSLQIGSLMVRNVPCLIKMPALRGLATPEGEAFSPLSLGLSAVIDYRNRELKLADDIGTEHQDVTLGMWFNRLATVRGLVNRERSASFIVDTGGQAVSISTDTARMLSSAPRRRQLPLVVIGTSGRDREAYLMSGISLAFDRISLDNYSVAVMNLRGPSILLGYRVGGTLGYKFLSNYRVTFDARRGLLGLSK